MHVLGVRIVVDVRLRHKNETRIEVDELLFLVHVHAVVNRDEVFVGAQTDLRGDGRQQVQRRDDLRDRRW